MTSSTDGFRYDLAKFISFRDLDACERVRAIRREDLTRHDNPELNIRVIDDGDEFYTAFATDLVDRIRKSRDESQSFVAIVPVGPMPQYAIAARMINQERLNCSHVHFFNMDEYADQDGNTAPASWVGSFQRGMWDRFLSLIDADLRPAQENCHFPTTAALGDYTDKIEQLGGADVC